jgi:hypothetical protein
MPATEAPAATRSTEEQLAWERRQRPRAAFAAVLAALLTLGAGIYSGLTFQDVPAAAGLLEALERVEGPGAVGESESLRRAQFEWLRDQFSDLMLAAVMTAAGALAMGGALTFLGHAVRWRKPEFSRGLLLIPMLGALLLAVARILLAIGRHDVVTSALERGGSVDAVQEATSGLLTAAQLTELAGTIFLGIGMVFIALNAMRTGLLTRFMGVLGIIAGVLFAFPIFGGGLPVVQSFWFLAIGVLFLGRWPGGVPPAWERGEAVPWPSAVEQRAAREGKAGGGERDARDRDARDRDGRGAEAPAAPKQAPQGSKKKRKRRG